MQDDADVLAKEARAAAREIGFCLRRLACHGPALDADKLAHLAPS